MLDERQPQGAKARQVVTRKREANSKETRNLENNLDWTNANSYASLALSFQVRTCYAAACHVLASNLLFGVECLTCLVGERVARVKSMAPACPNLHAKIPILFLTVTIQSLQTSLHLVVCLCYSTITSLLPSHLQHMSVTSLDITSVFRKPLNLMSEQQGGTCKSYKSYVPKNQPLQDCSRRMSMTARGSNGLYIRYLRHQVRLRG
jgi:hypothetical protein